MDSCGVCWVERFLLFSMEYAPNPLHTPALASSIRWLVDDPGGRSCMRLSCGEVEVGGITKCGLTIISE